jgi:ring-1,2-phenylacetyl-CoA epoxidase subunit PaaB
MSFFKKHYYGDYDAIKNSGGAQQQEATSINDPSSAEAPLQSPSPQNGRLGVSGDTWPLWEVFIRSKQGLDHKHVGSLHAADAQMAIENARDVYTRRQEGVSIWVVESKFIHASNPDDAESFYEPANDKVYRHPTFYDLPDEVKHM